MPASNFSLTAAILAGGKSSRMGTNKALLSLHGKPLLAHVAEHVAELHPKRTILIANDAEGYEVFDLPVYADVIPDKGSLGGIYSALYHSDTPYTLVVACDMPFISVPLLAHMISLVDGVDAVVPRTDDLPHGLCAIYRRQCMPLIEEHVRNNRFKVSAMLKHLKVRYIDQPEWEKFDPTGMSLANLNTPQELFAAQQYDT